MEEKKNNRTKEEKQEGRNKEGSTQTMKQKRQDKIDKKSNGAQKVFFRGKKKEVKTNEISDKRDG